MYNVQVIGPVVLSLSVGSGIAAGLFATRYFRAEGGVRRLFAFWPAFWLVSFLVFVFSMLIVVLIFGGPPDN
jgi:hypothetical protein